MKGRVTRWSLSFFPTRASGITGRSEVSSSPTTSWKGQERTEVPGNGGDKRRDLRGHFYP